MKTRKYHIVSSWILLICFIAGQYMVYAHQHNIAPAAIKTEGVHKNIPRQTLSEKCSLCDVMHHNAMVKTDLVYFSAGIIVPHHYKKYNYSFKSIQLILSGGRAPPAVSLNA